MAIFAEITENECIICRQSQELLNFTIFTQCYFEIQLQARFCHDEIFVNFHYVEE